ncbi:MAG: RHS repeat-associated core domain-containing protein [Chloroflexota bacterium]|nr:RHS repeat-associated core domain-containing protein [Chloroflexota bacterium]MBI5703748.1 RHS repeat-associated core domain-containing protein [Chloroflexota bacterium]
MKRNGVTIAQFTYDGDGRRVKSVVNGTTIHFVGAHYELTGSQVTKYYFAGATRIAMRKYTVPQSMSVEYFLGDHLGATSITTDANGAKTSELRYKPWGEICYTWTASLSTTPAYELTKYTYTGQYSHMDDPSTAGVTEGFGLMFYNARWYDPSLGRFAQADTIVPTQTQDVQAWDRYAYTSNNPVRYTDPTGHCPFCLTAVIGGAFGGIIGAIRYTAYVAATGREWNATHFWTATGGGALAGALIGTGVGSAVGVSTAGAATAALEAGTVAITANAACGGDMCASEVQDASKAIQTANQVCGGDMCASEVKDGTQQITTVIGRYPANKELAESIGANWLNIQDAV